MGLPALLTALSLHLVSPAQSTLASPVAVTFERHDAVLLANFVIQTPTIDEKPNLAPGEYPYQHDVVEVFVSITGDCQRIVSNLPYYEFEVSPLGQSFEVKIIDPKRKRIDGIKTGATYAAAKIPGGWKAQIAIPLTNLGWKGDSSKIVGNAFAILGARPNRSYWSLFLPPQTTPNFHKPAAFRCLVPFAPR